MFHGSVVGTMLCQLILLFLPPDAETLMEIKNLVGIGIGRGAVFFDRLADAEFPKVEVRLAKFQKVVRFVFGLYPTIQRIDVGVVGEEFVGGVSHFLRFPP